MEQRGGRGGADDKTEGQKEKADSIYVYQCTIKQVLVSLVICATIKVSMRNKVNKTECKAGRVS